MLRSLVDSEMCIRGRAEIAARGACNSGGRRGWVEAASYTHLTLPTIYAGMFWQGA